MDLQEMSCEDEDWVKLQNRQSTGRSTLTW